ncbi:MAG: DNA polymerase III subunit gamma/tau [Rhodocyclaceae bacterium]|nr:DNA polymerase III subunit gamma/tau [Rhodocyclaceae bacterium]
MQAGYQVLARKWRPKSFAALVGQEHVVKALSHALDQQRLHHAYLFTGTRGVGKTTIARIMAKALNCELGVTSTPCGQCSSCREIDTGRFVDYIELDAASNRGVDDMTQLLERATYAPTRGRYKVYVIDEVHQLSGHAFNAMLKTLEEPPAHVKFILATTDPQKIPVTVLSRCLQFNLKQMPPTHIVEHLARVLEAEGIPFDAAALRPLAKGAAGSMRDALSLLDQAIAHGSGEVREASVLAMLGTVSSEHLFAVIDALIAGDPAAMVEVAKQMEARSLSFDTALQDLATLFHRIALAQFAPQAIIDNAEREVLAGYAQALDAEYIQLAYQICIHGRDELELAPDDYAGFVMTLLRLHAFAPARSSGGSVTGGVSAGGAAANTGSSARAAASASPTHSPRAAPVSAAKVDVAPPIAVSPAPTSRSISAIDRVDVSGDADWHALVAQLSLTGMAKQLAQNCELSERIGNTFRLRLPPAHKHLLGKIQEDKLQSELQKRFGESVRVVIDVAATASETPAERSRAEQRQRHERAIESIEQDPFVREAVALFNAGIDESSIRPI